jgi:hypothetical protein
MINDDYVSKWLEKADKDLKVVEHELKLPEDERVVEAICFLPAGCGKIFKGFFDIQ